MQQPTVNTHRARRLTRARLLDGVDALSAADPDLAIVVTRFGPPPLWARRPGFATLVQIVLEQQVSLASGRATFGRLHDAWGEVTPERFAKLTTAQVRSAGVTRQKTSYCLGIAQQIIDLAAHFPGHQRKAVHNATLQVVGRR